MNKTLRVSVTMFLALGMVLGAAASYGVCAARCCCHEAGAVSSSAGTDIMLESAGTCCCGSVSDYRGESETAAVAAADEYRTVLGPFQPPAVGTGVRLADDRPIPHARFWHACNSRPVYILVSSYLI